MYTTLRIVLILTGALLVFVILAQARGGGLSATFGGEGSFHHVRRGPEKILFGTTIVLSVLFFFFALITPFVG